MSFASYEISKLESEVAELREGNTILKAERDEAIRTRDEIHHQLLNLLALAHRDGGHYVDEHGVEKSIADARDVMWRELTDEQRLAFLELLPCCRHCGSLDTGCQCWNDE